MIIFVKGMTFLFNYQIINPYKFENFIKYVILCVIVL